MKKLILLTLLLAGCASQPFKEARLNGVSFQDIHQTDNVDALIGQKIVVGGDILIYQQKLDGTTEMEILSRTLSDRGFPMNSGTGTDRALIIIPEKIAESRVINARISAVGTIQAIKKTEGRYSDNVIVVLKADDYKLWRAPATKQKLSYGLTYELN